MPLQLGLALRVSLGDKAAWVIGEAKGPRLVLYTLDETLTLARHEM